MFAGMVIRAVALAAGLTGAVGFSQFPEFTQQYVQRLGGAVDELSRLIRAFDADAAELGLGRDTALDQLATGGDFGASRAERMAETIARHDRLAADLEALAGSGAFQRVALARHFGDPEIMERTWQAYRPAVPTTPEGLAFAGVGFLSGWLALTFVLSLLALPFRPRRRKRAAARRREPVLSRPVPRHRCETPLRSVRGSAPAARSARLPRDI
jgi:hypothetical protein